MTNTQPDPMLRSHALKDSLRAKLSALPRVDHNGRRVDGDDPDRPRYGAGLVTPVAPATTNGGRR